MDGIGHRLRTPWGPRARTVLALAAGALAAACGGDFTGSDGGLDRAEASELATVMAGQAGRVMLEQVEEAPDAGAGVEISSDVLFNRGASCPGGGTVSVTGSVGRRSSADEDRMTLDFGASLIHDGCSVRLGDRNVTLAGAPRVGLQAVFALDGSELAGPQETRLEGRIRWSGSEASERPCRVDLTTTLSTRDDSLRVEGEVCGVPVDRTAGAPAVQDDPGAAPGQAAAGT